MEYLLLIIGFVLLIKGADFFVDGSSSLARFLKIPSVIIGLTIVAMGTSAPEASVSINAALAGNNDIAVSNVIGSNIFNILLILGLASTITPLTISMFSLIDIIFMTIITILLYLFMKKSNSLTKLHGYTFILIYIGYMTYTIMR